ncbi:Uncharacterized protein GBIM_15070 [Gryllus bimaculatus]|nr:Uncharacterized protein GBIM_15070 [Gryllus bimaculatus]
MANHVRDGGSRDLGPSRLLATPAGAFLKWPETRGPALVAHAHADLHFELGSTKETPGLAARQRKSFLNESKGVPKRNIPYTRGQATLFGFKRRPATAPSATSTPLLDNAPSPAANAPFLNSNRSNLCPPQEEEQLSNVSPISSNKSTPRLARPKKDLDGTNNVRTNRFGFRSAAPLAVTNKVADSNCNVLPPSHLSHPNIDRPNVTSTDKPRAKGGGKIPQPRGVESAIPVPGAVSEPPRNKNKPPAAKPEVASEPVQAQATRFTLQTTHLPKLQYPVRLSSVDVDVRNTSKIAKTAANNSTRRGVHVAADESSSKEGSVNEDSGIGSHQSTLINNGETDTLHGVEILESSPTFGYRRNRNLQKPRTLEMVVSGQCFDVQDLKDEDCSDPNVITEISVISLPKPNAARIARPVQRPGVAQGIVRERSRLYRQQVAQSNQNNDNSLDTSVSTHSDTLNSSEGSNCSEVLKEEGEEKAFRDSSGNEKSALEKAVTPGSMEEEDWGHGEAMAEEFSSSSDDAFNQCNFSTSSSSLKQSIPFAASSAELKTNPVILKIEDSRFAAFAATASTNMIEDEKSPVDSLISSASAPSSSADDISEEEQQKSLLPDDGQKEQGPDCDLNSLHKSSNTLSPESPGTPTNASNSLSLSEGRDFLIDDEIADQPGLTFDDGTATVGPDMATSSAGCSSLILSVTENVTLVDTPPNAVVQRSSAPVDGSPSPAKGRRISRTGSVDTLSPCESIASDDLMLDFERSERSELDCTAESHLDGSALERQHTLESTKSLDQGTDDSAEDPVKEWSVTASSLVKEAGLVTGRSRLLRPRAGSTLSTPDSPRASDSRPRAVGSPLRPQRASGGSECDDGGLYLDRHTYHSICQDIVNHKTMLLKLMRHLQKAETLNPFDSSLKNGLFYNLASTDTPSGGAEETGQGLSLQEEVADLQRQVVFLQQQLEEKEHTIQLLQIQMTKYSNAEVTANGPIAKETCNAATQTERIRPVSAGPSLLQQPLPSDSSGRPLVSLNDTRSWQRQPTVGSPAPAKSATRLPLMRQWKRNNIPPTDLGGSGEQSQIPVNKQNALNLATAALPQMAAATAENVATLSPASSTDRHAIHVTTK